MISKIFKGCFIFLSIFSLTSCISKISPNDFREASWYSEDPVLLVHRNSIEESSLHGTIETEKKYLNIEILFGPGHRWIMDEEIGEEYQRLMSGNYEHLNDDHDFRFTITEDNIFNFKYKSFIFKMVKE